MKTLHFALAFTLLIPAASVYSQAARDNSGRPCVDVNVQIDRNNQGNRADVQQDCGRNYSATSQSGYNNEARTEQSGNINSNTVRQFGRQ